VLDERLPPAPRQLDLERIGRFVDGPWRPDVAASTYFLGAYQRWDMGVSDSLVMTAARVPTTQQSRNKRSVIFQQFPHFTEEF
jgi:hypothetical protein